MTRIAAHISAALAAGALATIASAGLQAATAQPYTGFDHTHAGLTKVLGDVLEDGLVDYAALRKSPSDLEAYLATLAATTPAQHAKWSRDERFAFWINTYNGYTLQLIRDNGPVKSIKKIGGFFSSPWEKKFIPLPAFDPERKNEKITLDEIEHEILRPTFKDARVHAAVNCASVGCPPLRGEAFRADALEEQLTEQVAAWLADTARNQVRPVSGKIRVSKIFDWFAKDFGKSDENVVRWIADHVGDEGLAKELRSKAGSLKVKYVSYDWGINAQDGKR